MKKGGHEKEGAGDSLGEGGGGEVGRQKARRDGTSEHRVCVPRGGERERREGKNELWPFMPGIPSIFYYGIM